MAKSGAARYFESVMIGLPPFIARCHLAGHGVPLHTLMLITITKRKYLANEYSIVKEQPLFLPHKSKQVKGFLSPFTCLLTQKRFRIVLKSKNLKKFFSAF
jgi:hypothetical protein